MRGERDLPGAGKFLDPKRSIRCRNFVILLSVPVTSMASVSACTSIILARKISQICITSERVFRSCGYPQENEFAVHIFFVAEILHIDHVDEFFELLHDLLEHLVVAAHDDRHAGSGGVEGGTNVKGIDIEAASAEHSGNAGEDPELVLNEDGNCVAHGSAGAVILDARR